MSEPAIQAGCLGASRPLGGEGQGWAGAVRTFIGGEGVG